MEKIEMSNIDASLLNISPEFVSRCALNELSLSKQREEMQNAAASGKHDIISIHLKSTNASYLADCENEDGDTPLMMAAAKGHWKIVMLLLKYGVEIMHRNHKNSTAIHLAYRGGHHACVYAILDAMNLFDEADAGDEHKRHWNSKGLATLQDRTGTTLLHIAAAYHCRTVIREFLEVPGSILITDNKKNTVLHIAAKYGNRVAIETIIDAAKFATEGQSGHGIVTSNEVTEVLLMKNDDGDTALHLAAKSGWLKSVKLLVEYPEIVFETNNFRNTPLHEAVKNCHVRSADIILEKALAYGVGKLEELIKAKNEDGDTFLHIAASKNIRSLFKADNDDVCANIIQIIPKKSATLQEVDMLKELATVQNKDGNTALHIVARYGFDELVKILVEYSEAIAVRNNSGNTPLHEAADGDRDFSASIIQIMLKKAEPSHFGILINAQNDDGNTALHLAARKGYDDSVKILVEYSETIAIRNNYGNTPLHEAVSSRTNSAKIIRSIIQNAETSHAEMFKEFITAQNKEGNTALQMAVLNDNDDAAAVGCQ